MKTIYQTQLNIKSSIKKTYAFLILLFISSNTMVFALAPPPVPSNDDPCGATPLTVNSSCAYSAQTSVGATATAGVTAPGCASYSTGDVWFTAVVPANGTLTVDSQAGTMTDSGMAFYRGTCGTLTLISCDDDGSTNGLMSYLTNATLIAGETIWIRFWDYSDGTGTFNICASSPIPPPIPANDNCVGAIALTVNVDLVCTTQTSGTVAGATASGDAVGACFGTPDDDVWYSFVATSTTHQITLNNVTGSTTDLYHSVYNGICGALGAAIICSDPNTSSVTGLTIGNTYYIRIYSYTATINQTTTFNVCITTAPPMPACSSNPAAGEDCSVATPICNIDGYCGNTSGSYTVDTWSELTTAFCGSADNDSYISFVASSTTMSFYVWETSTTINSGIQIMCFSAATCGSGPVTSLSCWNTGSYLPGPTLVTTNGLVAGNTYYLLVDGFSGDVCDYVIGLPAGGGGVTLPVSVTPSTQTICLGSSVTLTGAGGNGTYNWTGANTADLDELNDDDVVATPTSIGVKTYTVNSISGLVGCPSASLANAVITVVGLPVVAPITGTLTACVGSTTTLSDATLLGVWSSATLGVATIDAGGIVTGVSAGTSVISYTVTTGGCSTTVTTTVTIEALPIVLPITGTLTACVGSTTTLSDATLLGVWSSASLGVATIDAGGIVTGVSAGTSVISYTVTTGGCSTTVTTTVTISALPVVLPITGTLTACVGSTTTLSDATLLGVWSSASLGVATISAGGIVTGVSGGSSLISYTVTTGICSTTVTTTVTITALPVVAPITGILTPCVGSTTTLSNITPLGIWSSASLGVATISAGGVVTGVSAGTSIISYIVSSGGCSTTVAATVTVGAPTIIAPITGTLDVCEDETTILSDATALGVWSSASTGVATIDNSGIVTGISAGTSLISYSITNGSCTSNVSATVTVYGKPIIASITGLDKICAGTSTLLEDATLGGIWISNSLGVATITAGGVITGIAAGTSMVDYELTILGCTNTESILFTVNGVPNGPANSGDVTYCSESTFANMTADPSLGGTLKWYSDAATILEIGQGISFMPLNVIGITDYYIVETANGCIGLPSHISINVTNCGVEVFTAITPDNDGMNDKWIIEGIDSKFPNNVVLIYNRWGELIFESPKGKYEANPWDGTYKGKLLPVDSYFYMIEFNDEVTETSKGNVSILVE